MEVQHFIIQIVLILFAARILGELAAFFKAPAVIGELLAGLLLGPSILNWVELSTPIELLSQIGVILLLFEVGIETDVARLTMHSGKAFSVALGGVVFPALMSFWLSYQIFGFDNLTSLFVGATLTATSIGITLRVLRDLNQHTSHESQIILGAAVIDDVIGIILLALLYEFAVGGSINLLNTGKVLVFIVAFFLIAPLVGQLVSKTIKTWNEKSSIPGLLPTTIVALILLFAWLAHQLGAPELLGGFAAGLALSRQFVFPFAPSLRQTPEFSHKVEKQMRPIIHLFTPIFFVAVGLSFDLQSIQWKSSFIWIFSISLFLLATLGKLLSGFILYKEKFKSQLTIGTAMIPRGEVGLIFASVGMSLGVLKDEVYASLLLVIVATTLLAPFLLRSLYSIKEK